MPIIKKSKGFKFPPKEEFERVVKRAQKSHRRTNILLHPNASTVERTKYNLCKSIVHYLKVNNLSEKELAQELGIAHAKVEKILFCHIDELNLEELINYLEKLAIPLEIKSNCEYAWKKTSSQAH